MSELMNRRNGRRIFCWQLLIGVSALALLADVTGSNESKAADQDVDRPTVWIELGVQLEQVSGFGDPFAPPFTSGIIADGFTSPLKLQHALSQSFGGESRISFQPENSDWVFLASVLYGRANGHTATHEQTPGCPCKIHIGTQTGFLTPSPPRVKFSGTQAGNSEAHAILDFQAGKDIGLGLLINGGTSSFSFGVRFAQLTSKQVLGVNADPDLNIPTNIKYSEFHHTYAVISHITRSFHGLGPSISWNASAPIVGHADNGGLSLDWGLNAALLFGRQKVGGHHQTIGAYYKTNAVRKYHFTSHFQRSGNPDRSRTVLVPNLGGFAGLSFRYSDAKISLGYRADLFFGAMDGGIDTRKNENVGFYGPFATVSVGIAG
jgi:hypothetical protein